MSAIVHARVFGQSSRACVSRTWSSLETLLAEAARGEPTYLDFSTRSCARGRLQAAQARRDGHDHRAFPLREDARRVDFSAASSASASSASSHRPRVAR